MPRNFAILIVSLTALMVHPGAKAEASPGQKAVLVTGASSGLGRKMTEAMAAQGYFVYAGARKDKDMAELNAIENVQAVRLDVNEKDFHFQMEVNIFGVYRITRAFAPLIIESKGRIGIMGSIAGTLSSATWGPYAMTKHAMEAYADALADEMRQFGVKVSLIEPGTYKSKIAQNALDRMEARNQSAEDSQFQAAMDESVNWLTAFERDSGDPAEVAEAVMQALFDDERMVEQNQDQKYSYDRDALVEMLDAALAKQPGANQQQERSPN